MEVQSPSVDVTNAVKTCGGSYPPLPTQETTPAENTLEGNGIDVVVPVESILAISERFVNTTYGFFLGKLVAYPVVANYGRSSYATVMIDLQADVEVKDNIVVAMPKINEEGYYTYNVHLRAGAGETKKKKHSQASKGISVGPKMAFKPNQEYRHVPKNNTLNSSGNKKICVDSTNK
nr:RNA-directed DNA polymerase, eukaryota, reverse transcriptase zinc-binding domain protein [Tanacetum cinerariifolium]